MVLNGTEVLPPEPVALPAGATREKLASLTSARNRVARRQPGLGDDDDGAVEGELRGRVEGGLLVLAVAAVIVGGVEVAGLEEGRVVQAQVGIVGRIGVQRRVIGVTLGGQNRVRVGQGAGGQPRVVGQQRVLDEVPAERRPRCRRGRP